MNRKTFLQTALSMAMAGHAMRAETRAPRILLRSSWQVVNIGDIAHSPGVIALLERYLPEAEVRLWPSSLANGVEEMLRRRFPKLRIVSGPADEAAALAACDFMLHGSGPSLVGANELLRWRSASSKPYGVYGITLSESTIGPRTVELLTGARFVFFRDTESLRLAKARGVASTVMEFGPDGAFAADLRNDEAAHEFLGSHGLEAGRFLCCIPRYRMTPGWMMLTKKQPYDAERDRRNQEMKEHDHAPLRAAITGLVRELKLKVLLCPEDETQIVLAKEALYDQLPADVKAATVWRDHFWLTDEALSTYRLSAGVFGNEMHSPILCIGNGVPAIVCRWEEQTSKGIMWKDIGLSEWLFNLDVESDVRRIAPTVLSMARDPAGARRKVERARQVVMAKQKETMGILRREMGLPRLG